MPGKHLRRVLILLYASSLILNISGLFAPGLLLPAYAASTDSYDPDRPADGQPDTFGAPPGCPNDDVIEPTINNIGTWVQQLTSPNGTSIAPNPAGVDAAPTETVTFEVRIENGEVGRPGGARPAYNVFGELVINLAGNPVTITLQHDDFDQWTWPGTEHQLLPGQVAVGIATYVVPITSLTQISYRFNGWGTYDNPDPQPDVLICDQQVSSAPSSPGPINVIGPGLELSFTASPPSAAVGDPINWTLTITNRRFLATTVFVDDLYFEALPCNTLGTNEVTRQLVRDDGATVPGPSDPLTLNPAGAPGSGAAATANFSCDMDESYPNQVTNTATVHATAGGKSVDFRASVSVNKLLPSIRVTKSANVTQAAVGDVITYTIRVENVGNLQLNNVTVVDTLAGLLVGVPSTLCPVPAGGCVGPSSYTQDVQYTVRAEDADPLINIVTAFGVTPSGSIVTSNWTVSVDKTNPAVQLEITSVSPPEQSRGNPVTYNYRVTNTGPSGLVNLSLDICKETPTGCVLIGDDITLGATSLASGASTTGSFTYTLQADDPDPFITRTTATATTTEGATVQDTATAVVDITNAFLRVTKTPDRSVALRGDTITYTITIENTSGTTLDIVSITDSLLGDITSAIPPANRTMNGGDSRTINVQYTVTGNDPDPLLNAVTVQTDDPSTPGTANDPRDTASAVVDISDAQLFVTVTSTPAREIAPGTVVPQYAVNFTNVGRVTMTDIEGTWQIENMVPPHTPQPFPITFPGASGVLAPFQSASGSFSLGRTVSSSDPDPFIVTVRITGRDDQNNLRTFIGVARLDVLATQLRISKTASASRAAVGDNVTYRFYVENISGGPIDNVRVSDPICSEPTVAPGSCVTHSTLGTLVIPLNLDDNCDGTPSGGGGPAEELDLLVDQCALGSLVYTVQATDLNLTNRTRVNEASVIGTIAGIGQVTDASFWELEVFNPLVVEKVADTAVATDGQNVQYTITTRNIGAQNAITGVVVTDPRLNPGSPVIATYASLAPGASQTEVVNYTVNFLNDRPRIANTVTAIGTANGQTVSATASWEVEVVTPITGQKTGPAVAIIGDTLDYRVDLLNVSDTAWHILAATDTMAHLGVAVDVLPFLDEGADGTETTDDNILSPGEIAAVEYTYVVSPTDPDELVNTFTITVKENPADPNEDPLTFFTTHTVEVFSPFSIIKVPDRAFATVGQQIHYDFVVFNVAEIGMAQVTVTDDHLGPIAVRRHDLGGAYSTAPQTLPPVTNPACAPFGCYLESNPADPATNYTVTPADLASETLINTVTARGVTQPPASPVIILTTEQAEVAVGNPLQVIKIGPPIANVGDPITYSVQIINNGDNDITITSVIDDQAGGDITGLLTWPEPGNVLRAHGAPAVGTVPVTIPQAAPDPFVNTIEARGQMVIGGTTYELISIGRAEVDITNPILSVDLIPSAPEAERNTDYRWTAQITNNGRSDIVNLVYVDSTGFTIPVGAGACPSAIPGKPSDTAPPITIICSWDYPITASTPDPLVNTLRVSGRTTGGTDVAAQDTEIVDLINNEFRVSKVASSTVAFIGDAITYQITVTNASGSDMTGITAFDTLTGPVTFSFPNGTQGTIGSLRNGEQAVGYVTYTITQADPSPLFNTVSASGFTAAGNQLSDSTYTSVLISSSQLLVDKRATPTIVQIGQRVTYNVSITNIGQTRITGLQVADPAVGLVASGAGSSCTGCTITTSLTTATLNPFEVAYLSYTVDVTAGLPDPFLNTITVTGTDPSGNSVDGSDTVAVDIVTPELQVTKTADRSGAAIGDRVQYIIQVTNLSPTLTLTGLQVWDNDLGPSGPRLVTVVDSLGQPVTTLSPGQTARGVVFYTVEPTTPNPFVNTVTATTNQGIRDGAAASIEIRNLGISVIKTPQVTSAVVGEEITYNIEVTNTSDQTLTAVTAIDQLSGLPVTLTFDLTDSTPQDGVLAPNETATGTFRHTVQPSDSDPLVNRVTASGRAPSGVVVSSGAIALVDIRQADIVLEKTAENPPAPYDPLNPVIARIGDEIVYHFTVSNAGVTPLNNVQVTDPLCATATSGCLPGNRVDLTASCGSPCTLGPSGSPNDTATGEIRRTVRASDPDPLTNVAIATGVTSTGVTIQDSDSATVQFGASPLVVAKTVAGLVTNPSAPCTTATPTTVARPGDTVAYNIRVENVSTNPADLINNVQARDALTGDLVIFQTAMSDTIPTLGAGGADQGCITVDITDSTPDPLVNTVIATGTLASGASVTDTSSATLTIASGALVVTNVPSQAIASIGETVTFNVTVRNTGNHTITGLTATSPHAPGGVVTLGAATLSPGQSTTGSYTHQIGGLDADPFLSTVFAQATAPGATLTDQATASVDIVSPTPGLRVSKIVFPTQARVGDDIQYTITITNTGAEDITAMTVIDPLLGGDITARFDPATSLPLIPGASASATITHTVTANDGDPVVNVAAVTATTISGSTLSDTASASVNLVGNGLTVIKTANVAAARHNDTITYTLEVVNTSLTEVRNLTVADTLVPGVTLPRTTLAAGERLTTTYTHRVDTSVDSDPVENVALVSGRDALGVAVSDTSSASVSILDSAYLRVRVIPDRATALPTQIINYLVTITNIGDAPLTNVSATATRPDGTTQALFATPIATLGIGESATSTFDYQVRVNEIPPITARVTATGTHPTAGTVTATGSSAVGLTTSSINSDLRTVGCGVPCVAVVGDTLNFLATIFNDGATLLTNVTVDLPAGAVVTAQDIPLVLEPGDRATVNFSYLVPLGVPDPLEVAIEVQGTDTVGVQVFHNFSLVLDTARPRIGVTLRGDRTIAPVGETITYTAEISNSGNERLTNIAAIDNLFGPLTNLPRTTLDPGTSMSVTYTHQITSGDLDPLVNTLTVSGVTSFNRSVADNDTYVLNIQKPELFLLVSATRQVANVGDRIDYTVSILNIGDGPIGNLQGNYTAATLQSGTAGQQRPYEQGGMIIIALPFGASLAEGASTTGGFSHVVTSGDNNPLTLRVTVTGQGLVGTTPVPVTASTLISIPLITVDAFGNPIVVGTPIPGVANPEVTKDSDQPFAVPGGLVTWTVTVRNPGTDPLSNIIITDTLTSNMTLETVTINNGTIQSEGNTIAATTGVLQFNETAVLTIVARVASDVFAGEMIQNIGCATSIGGDTSICDTAIIRVAPEAELLPATGHVDGSLTGTAGPVPVALALLGLLLLGGLFGINLKDPDPGTRLVMAAVLIAAAIIIIAAVAALVINLTSSLGRPAAEAEATATATSAVMVEGPEVAPSETPATAPATEPPPVVAPTAIPIPSPGAPLPPTITPTPVPPFHPQYDRELFIPRLGLAGSVPIIEIPLRNQTWDVRELGQYIGFLQGTTWVSDADAETGGNTVLAGHIQITEGVPGPFRDLDLLEVGDSIFVAERGTIYEYAVTAIDVVAPDDIEVAYPTREPVLTLVTCTAWNQFRGVFAERLVVRATPVRSLSYQ